MSAITTMPGIQHLPALDGCYIYFLTRGEEVVYVGQTSGLISRITGHNGKIFDGVSYLPVAFAQLSFEEARFIKMFNPKYNQMEHNGTERNWERTQIPGLQLYRPTGRYFINTMIGGKHVRRSLKTESLELARVRLGALLEKAGPTQRRRARILIAA